MSGRMHQERSKSEEILVETKLLEAHEKQFSDNVKKSTAEDAKKQSVKRLLANMPTTKSTRCGFWIFKGSFLQRFANQTSYVLVAGITGCIFNTIFSYFNGTLSTMEKRFKIPSRNSGIIYVGYDTSTLLIAGVLCYYAGKGHRPRWIGFGMLTLIIYALLMALPHFIYGPGESSLALTAEFGAELDVNATKALMEQEEAKSLCRKKTSVGCDDESGSLTPQIIFFIAEFIAGVGGSLFDSLGASYMDDNIEKAKAPLMLSICYFLRMLGPATGYVMASFCLQLYIAPYLTPMITNDDPRWLGAWWLGWLIIGGLLAFFVIFLTMFPKHMPLAIARRIVDKERKDERSLLKQQKTKLETIKEEHEAELQLMGNIEEKIAAVEAAVDSTASFKDMIKTFKELMKNETYMYNNWAAAFFCFGYTPFWMFTPKYIEIQYRQSASTASLVTGVAGFAFSAIGVLSSGFIISRYKPSARKMAAWNVICTLLTIFGIISYVFIGCDVNEDSMVVNIAESNVTTCNSACECDYVQYSPVCGENGKTYISPCHAGCQRKTTNSDGKQAYYECTCVPKSNVATNISSQEHTTIANGIFGQDQSSNALFGGQASSGACPVDCSFQFIVFILILSSIKFMGASAQASLFLLNVRCVPEKDKTASMGFGMMMLCLLVFIPAPIFFGWVMDCICLVWGKTCTSEGNCWLYDARLLRYVLNFSSASIIVIGLGFYIAVWTRVKDLKLFDEDVVQIEMEAIQSEGTFISHRKRNSF